MTNTERKRSGKPDLREIIELHAETSKKFGQLSEAHQALLGAGKKTAAKEVLKRVERIRTVMRALEAQLKQSDA